MEVVPLGAPGEDGVALPGDTRALQRHLCVTQLSRCLGLQHAADTQGKLSIIKELKAHYRHGLQFGKHRTREVKISSVSFQAVPHQRSGFLKWYDHFCVFAGTSCLKTELQFSDMYCVMAAHVYIDLWKETGESTQCKWIIKNTK